MGKTELVEGKDGLEDPHAKFFLRKKMEAMLVRVKVQAIVPRDPLDRFQCVEGDMLAVVQAKIPPLLRPWNRLREEFGREKDVF